MLLNTITILRQINCSTAVWDLWARVTGLENSVAVAFWAERLGLAANQSDDEAYGDIMQQAMTWWDPLASWAAEKSNGHAFDVAVTTAAPPTTASEDKMDSEIQSLTLIDPMDTVAAMQRLQIPGYATVIYGSLALRRHAWKLCLQMAGKLERRNAATHAAAAVLYQYLFDYFATEKMLLDWPLGARNALHTWIQQFQWTAGPLGRHWFTQGFQLIADLSVGSLLRDVCIFAVQRFKASQPCSLTPKPSSGPPSLTIEQREQLEELVLSVYQQQGEGVSPSMEHAIQTDAAPVLHLAAEPSIAEHNRKSLVATLPIAVKLTPAISLAPPQPQKSADEEEDRIVQEENDRVLVDDNKDDDDNEDGVDDDEEEIVVADEEEEEDEAVAEVVEEKRYWAVARRTHSDEDKSDEGEAMESDESDEPRDQAPSVESGEDAIQILGSEEEEDDDGDDDDEVDSEEDNGSYERDPYQSEDDMQEGEHSEESEEEQYDSDRLGGEDAPIELEENCDDGEVIGEQDGFQCRTKDIAEDMHMHAEDSHVQEDEGTEADISEEAPEDQCPTVLHTAEPDGDENYYATAEESQEDDDEMAQNLSQDESAVPPPRIFPSSQEPGTQHHVQIDAPPPPIRPIQPTPKLDDGYLPEDEQGQTEDEMNMPPPIRARMHHERDGYQGGESSLGHTEEEDGEISEAAEDEEERSHIPETMENGSGALQAPPVLDSHSLSGMSAADERGPEEEYSELEEVAESGEQMHFPPTHSMQTTVKPQSTSLVDYALASAQQEMPELRKQRLQQSSDISHRPYVDSAGMRTQELSESDDVIDKVSANTLPEQEAIRIAEEREEKGHGANNEKEGDEETYVENETEEFEEDRNDEVFVNNASETIEVSNVGGEPENSDTVQVVKEASAAPTGIIVNAIESVDLAVRSDSDHAARLSKKVNARDIQIEDANNDHDQVEILDAEEVEPVVGASAETAPTEESPAGRNKPLGSMPEESASTFKNDDTEGMAVETIAETKAAVESEGDQNKMADDEIPDDMATEKVYQTDPMLDDADDGVENMEADDENDEMAVDDVDKEEMVIDDGDVEMDATNESVVLDEEMKDETVGMDAPRAASSLSIEPTMSVDEAVEKSPICAPDGQNDSVTTNSKTFNSIAANTEETRTREHTVGDASEIKDYNGSVSTEVDSKQESRQLAVPGAKADETDPSDDDVLEVVEEPDEMAAEVGSGTVGLSTLPAALEPIPEDEDQEPQQRPSFITSAADPASLFQSNDGNQDSDIVEHGEKSTSNGTVVSKVPQQSPHKKNEDEDSTATSSKRRSRRTTRASAAKRASSDTESVETDSKRATSKNEGKDDASATTPKKKSGVQDDRSIGSRSTRRSARLAAKTPAPPPAGAHHDDDDVSVLSEGTETSAALAVQTKTARRSKKNKGSDEESHASAPSKASASIRPRRLAKNPPATPNRGADEAATTADLVARRTRSAAKATPDATSKGSKHKRVASSASKTGVKTDDDEDSETPSNRQRATRSTRSKAPPKNEDSVEDGGDAVPKSGRKRNAKKPPPPTTRNLRSRK